MSKISTVTTNVQYWPTADVIVVHLPNNKHIIYSSDLRPPSILRPQLDALQ